MSGCFKNILICLRLTTLMASASIKPCKRKRKLSAQHQIFILSFHSHNQCVHLFVFIIELHFTFLKMIYWSVYVKEKLLVQQSEIFDLSDGCPLEVNHIFTKKLLYHIKWLLAWLYRFVYKRGDNRNHCGLFGNFQLVLSAIWLTASEAT